MRRFLDGLYWTSGAIGCVFMVGIAAMITAQIVGRIAGFQVPSADDISGYFMGASTFFALAYALRRGGHIRVELLLQRLGGGLRRVAEVWSLGDRPSVEEIAHLVAGLVEQGVSTITAAELLARAETRALALRRPEKPRVRPVVGDA